MDKFSKTLLFSCFLIMCFSVSSHAQTCSDYSFSNNAVYSSCNSLPVLNSFIHWNYSLSYQTVDLAYRHTGLHTSNWIVWALNPTGNQMLGSQCLVGFQNSTGSFRAYTSPIASSPAGYNTVLQQGNLSFTVLRIAGAFVDGQMIIYATIRLPSNNTNFNHVWQFGNLSRDTPQAHPTNGDNMRSFGTIDFASGRTVDSGATSRRSIERIRGIHGVLNAVSWGILMPVGVMMARYLKVFKGANPAWLYLHVTCEALGYMAGVAGWATGMRLGSDSPGVQHRTHRNIGITIFALATLQMFVALLLRPKPEHKKNFYWNIHHHLTGYTVIILSIVNIIQGSHMFGQGARWRPNISVMIFLGASVLVLEPFTWYVVLKRKRKKRSDEEVEEAYLDLVPDMPTRFSYEELVTATENFSKKLGEGGFGSVFQGLLKDNTQIAVKCLDGIGHIKKSFLAEVWTIGNIHHINLVRLVGFCADKSHRLLVYDYMCNGSLDKWIYSSSNHQENTLDWRSRRKIIHDIAKGLSYLHEDCRQKIIHLDIKPQNILLNENYSAKLADFGLSKLIDRDQSQVVTTMRGTPGYLAPEWLSAVITEKVDVYSFGIVTLEIICGRRNFEESQPEEDRHLLSLFKKKAEEGQWLDIVDKCIVGVQSSSTEAVEIMQIAAWCLQSDYKKRPSMSNVTKLLEGVIDVQRDLDFNFLIPLNFAHMIQEIGSENGTLMLPSVLSGPR